MSANTKDTVYIDVDEEITGIVSKVSGSSKNIVALVLPKRANVLQSIVNMKLLKRAADQNDKQVVLITSESRLLPLAGAAKLFVAPNLTSKPYIPPAPAIDENVPSSEDAGDITVDPKTPVSEVAPGAKFADDEEPVEIDNTPKQTADKPPAPVAAKSAKPSGKKKIPNFSNFRKKLLIGGLVALLLVGLAVWALLIAPKAKITLKTQSDNFATTLDFTADKSAQELNEEEKIVPAKAEEIEKNDSESVDATGERNEGKKASGTVTLKNCSKTAGSVTIPAGTGVSSGEYTFVTEQAVTLPPSIFTGTGACITSTKDTAVAAQEAGDEYNLSSREYTVAGKPGVQAIGSNMSGGTNKIVKIVSQKDIDSARERLASKQNNVQEELSQTLDEDGYIAVKETFKSSPGAFNPSPGVNSVADKVTVSVTTKYTILGVKKDDLKKLVEKEVKSEESNKQRQLLDDGIAKGTFKIGGSGGSQETVPLSFQTTVVVGPDINQDDLRQELAGKKKGAAEDLLKSRPGIIEPTVKLSPFWVTSVPGKASKVTFEIQQSDGSAIDTR